MADKCHMCGGTSYDNCKACGQPTCSKHGRRVGDDFVCRECADKA